MDMEIKDDYYESEQIEHDKKQYRFAGFWMRLWAFLLDGLIVFSINGILIYPLIHWQGLQEETLWIFTISGVLTTIVTFLYFILTTKFLSQTLGKRVFGLKVIAIGDKLSWPTVIFREGIGRFILQSFFFMQLLYLVVAFSKEKQGIHDMIADTYVIHEE